MQVAGNRLTVLDQKPQVGLLQSPSKRDAVLKHSMSQTRIVVAQDVTATRIYFIFTPAVQVVQRPLNILTTEQDVGNEN
jgi:hypothetical protein